MDNFDFEIKKILKKEINKPLEYEYAIKNAFLKKDKNKKNNVFFSAILAMSCLLMISTVVVATTHIVYDNIWKNPVKISIEEKEKEIKEEIREEEKIDFIDESKAIEISNQILNELGYEEKNFKNVELIRDYDQNIHYLLKTENEIGQGILINLNPKTGELEYFCDDNVRNRNLKCDDISEEQAIKIANEVYTKLGIFNKNNRFEIIEIESPNFNSDGNLNTMWKVTFGEKYNGLVNKETLFTTCFSVVDGKNIFYIIKGKTNKEFIGNPVIISEDTAKEKATNKEKEFSSLEISDVKAKLSIEKMNLFVFCLENNIENKNGEYQVEDISRVVWIVEIKHNKQGRIREYDLQTVKEYYNKKYYVDVTTGEIIGGAQAEFFN